jgi:hypothetical protein
MTLCSEYNLFNDDHSTSKATMAAAKEGEARHLTSLDFWKKKD